MTAYLDLISWGTTAIIALAVSLIALKKFKCAPIWAVVIGIVVFSVLRFPIPTHAIALTMPLPK